MRDNMTLYIRVTARSILCAAAIFCASSLLTAKEAEACCWACPQSDCDSATDRINGWHDDIYSEYQDEFDRDLDAFEEWMIDDFFEPLIVPAMADMMTQMGAVAMQYTTIIGLFLDAQVQMDTQRLYRKLQFQAHKDYMVSEDFCWFGTNVKSLAASEDKAKQNVLVLSRLSMDRMMGTLGTTGAQNKFDDYKARWNNFITDNCDRRDNNAQTDGVNPLLVDATGLQLACDHDGQGSGSDMGADLLELRRVNRDIDYIRLIDEPRTLDVDFTNADLDSSDFITDTLGSAIPEFEPDEEEDIIALSQNLYGSKLLSRKLSRAELSSNTAKNIYFALRSLVAKRTVAQTSFNAIVGLKSYGTSWEMNTLNLGPGVTLVGDIFLQEERQTERYMAAIIKQLFHMEGASVTVGGLMDFSGGNIMDFIGFSPSYYSQLEILAKRIYQNPDFYANLYDSPTNVSRKKVAMQAIGLMVDRAMYESQLRREMSISVLLASRLNAAHRLATREISVGEDN